MKRITFIIIAALLFIIASMKAETNDSIELQENEITNTETKINTIDSILYSKLSTDQLMQLRREENSMKERRMSLENPEEIPLNGFGIVMIVLIPFLFIILIVLVTNKQRNKESQRKYDLYTKSLEMGQNIPEHFFEEPKKIDHVSNLQKGILWLAVGLAVLIYFIVIRKDLALILGIVPTFVGIGYLLVHFLDKPKKTDEQDR